VGSNQTSKGTIDGPNFDAHPWISFNLDLSKAPPELWLLLGEARSKIQHLAESLLAPETGERLRMLYLAKGVHATTAIEGNTLSEGEVAEHLAGQLKLPPSQDYLTREVDNIVTAYNSISEELFDGGSRELTPTKIREYNRLILDGLEVEDGVVPGELAMKRPGVGRYLAPPREDCDALLERLCHWLNDDFVPPDEDMAIPYAIIKAIVAHLYVAWIHYFGDGNGRTARCVEVQILAATGLVPAPAGHLLSNHYNITRDEYYRQLESSTREHGGNPGPFLLYAVRGLVGELRAQLAIVWNQLFADRWEQHIYRQFGDTQRPPAIRQRQLVLDLSKRDGPVLRSEIRELSPKVAVAYAERGDKTLTRDLNALINRGLIEQGPDGYLPLRGKILTMMPPLPDAEDSLR
jgi:cell filamentation protein, protein adenylyltransferase